eukprot:1145643-Pelagomonas_calceolata.AAC.4
MSEECWHVNTPVPMLHGVLAAACVLWWMIRCAVHKKCWRTWAPKEKQSWMPGAQEDLWVKSQSRGTGSRAGTFQVRHTTPNASYERGNHVAGAPGACNQEGENTDVAQIEPMNRILHANGSMDSHNLNRDEFALKNGVLCTASGDENPDTFCQSNEEQDSLPLCFEDLYVSGTWSAWSKPRRMGRQGFTACVHGLPIWLTHSNCSAKCMHAASVMQHARSNAALMHPRLLYIMAYALVVSWVWNLLQLN